MTRELLEAGFEELGGAPPAANIDALVALAELVASWAARVNLTAHREPDAIARRLILDAAALREQLPSFEVLVDLGSGAGFPGLPLAILEPNRSFVLVEAREKRHFFQRAACRELALTNVEPLRGRAESLEPRIADAVIAQAMARPEEAVRLIVPWLAEGGVALIPGGEAAPNPGPHPELVGARVTGYEVPLGGPARTLWSARRRKNA